MESPPSTEVTIRKPVKVLHFSDGVLEVFDDEIQSHEQEKPKEETVDEAQLDWTPWFKYKTSQISNKVLNGLDYTGEKIADFLGITSPKYAYEIMAYEQEQAKRAQEEQFAKDNTWTLSNGSTQPITTPPSQTKE